MNAQWKKIGAAVVLGGLAYAFDHFGAHLVAVFMACCAANAVWYDAS